MVWLPTFFKVSSLVFPRWGKKKSRTGLEEDEGVHKDKNNFHFGVNYLFN